jgi:hypothetical protein
MQAELDIRLRGLTERAGNSARWPLEQRYKLIDERFTWPPADL